HSAVQGDSSRQGVASLLTLCCLEIQRAEPAVAVGHERAHAEFLGQGEGLLVVGFHLRVLWWLTPCCNVAEEAQGICLVAPFLVRTCMRQRTHGEGVCLPQAACQHLCLPEGETTERLKASTFHGKSLFQRLREQQHGVSNAPAQGIGCTQGRGHGGEIEWQVCVLANTDSPFKQG